MIESKLQTPLAVLGRERKWRSKYMCDDGAGCLEIYPGAMLEVDRRAVAGWSIGLEVRLPGPPDDVGALTVDFAEALEAAAKVIRGTAPGATMGRGGPRGGVARRYARAAWLRERQSEIA